MVSRKPKKELTPNKVALLLLRLSLDLVTGARQNLETNLNVKKQSQLQKVEEELTFFCWFAVDYWISNDVAVEQERREIREALSYHWRKVAGGDEEVQPMQHTLYDRLNAYGQIVNENESDQAVLFGLARKLSELCCLPGNPYLLVLAPDLFTGAMEGVTGVLREGK